MKTVFLAVLTVAAAAALFGITPQHSPQSVMLEGGLNYPTISENGGIAYFQLRITTPAVTIVKERKPMNLAIVLDRSGSMSDEKKIEYAKKAFRSLIDQLSPNDLLSVVVYDDAIDILRNAKKVGRDKASLKRLLDEIEPRGSTNLGGGLAQGLSQTEKNASRHYINRVVLLSDGLANVGMTNPSELNRLVQRYRRHAISVTTMGVGLDYNENLMIGLAESGGGNYYFIERANDLAAIVRKEFDMLSSVVAQNGSIHIHLGDGVAINDVIGCEYRHDRNEYVIPIGDLYSNDRREVTIELTLPPGTGSKTIASAELRYDTEMSSVKYPTVSSLVRYSRDAAEIEKNRDLEIQAKADIALSTRKVEQAMEALDDGRKDEAERHLDEAKNLINASPAASAAGAGGDAVRSQLGRIESFQKSAKEEDARRAKKSIQYENYRVQKNK